jgi:hypothetical protein
MPAGRPSLEAEVEAEKAYQRVVELAKKHELELETDLSELVKHILLGHYVGGVGKLFTKEAYLNEAIRYWAELRAKKIYGPTTQRAFECIGELLGYLGDDKSRKMAGTVEVVIDAVNKK